MLRASSFDRAMTATWPICARYLTAQLRSCSLHVEVMARSCHVHVVCMSRANIGHVAAVYRPRVRSMSPSMSQSLLVARDAWRAQINGSPNVYSNMDVESDAIMRLEELMFENSSRAEVSGYRQWGLDAGDHEGAWNPYHELPPEWDHQDRQGSEKELVVSFNLIVKLHIYLFLPYRLDTTLSPLKRLHPTLSKRSHQLPAIFYQFKV